MTNEASIDPYFDDEDEENEEFYRQLLRNNERLPPCDPATLPVTSPSERCTLCSRVEAENILKTNIYARPGHFIVRPSAHANYPYSMSVLTDKNNVFHFQIGQKSNQYVLGPLETNEVLKLKMFPSLAAFLEYYIKFPIKFQVGDGNDIFVLLQLFPTVEITRL